MSKAITEIVGYEHAQVGSESSLLDLVCNDGPAAVGIDASHMSFQLYTSGVYDEPACSSTELDHHVTVLGYGIDGSTPYWLVRNSWGTNWGMQGYIWMSRNKNNQCGIATDAVAPGV
jgi:cathepsin L